MSPSQSLLRRIPAVEKAVAELEPAFPFLPRPLLTAAVQDAVAELRDAVRDGTRGDLPEPDALMGELRRAVARFERTRIVPVINGTGVLIHTNLGRSPLGESAGARLHELATSYCNVEIDLDDGRRGPRAGFLERAMAALCHAESATVVNNCAAALVLVLKTLTSDEKDEVVVSRGELIEIGGGFRIPEILAASGARLVEVGTTNKTHARDYATAVGPRTALVLSVHRSNFSMQGFVASPSATELAAIALEHGIPLVQDLGSGALMATDKLAPIEHEPTPWESLRDGFDLVCFSGDKLLGGPQAGVVAGKQALVARVKRAPFYRALRPDKLVLAALQETAVAYLHAQHAGPGDLPEVPVLRMLSTPVADLEARARALVATLAPEAREMVRVSPSTARCGGGTMPAAAVPSVTLDIALPEAGLAAFAAKLRDGTPPVVGYTGTGTFRIDLRTVLPRQDPALAARLADALG